MRSLSLAARGGFLDKALDDLRKVAWDRGPIRYSWKEKADGTRVALWHDSEVAVLAYAIQSIIGNRSQAAAPTLNTFDIKATTSTATGLNPELMSGKKCPECGAHAVILKDGCSFCTACGYIGACG